MTSHFTRGAFVKGKTTYVPVLAAKKNEEYSCPGCGSDVIFRAGNVREHHFSHKPDSSTSCSFYDLNHSNESELHKHAKLTLATLLEQRTPIAFECKCDYASLRSASSCRTETISLEAEDSVSVEHRSEIGTVYDVAVLRPDGTVKYVLEIKHTHATQTVRPEPWFEVMARDVSFESSVLNCCRTDRPTCADCEAKQIRIAEEVRERERRVAEERRASAPLDDRYYVRITDRDDPRDLGCRWCSHEHLWYSDDDEADQRLGIYLEVKFADKDRVKSRGARWDPEKMKWYVPPQRFYNGTRGERNDLVRKFGFMQREHATLFINGWLGTTNGAVNFSYDEDMVCAFKETFKNARWNVSKKVWVFHLDQLGAVRTWLNENEYVIHEEEAEGVVEPPCNKITTPNVCFVDE